PFGGIENIGVTVNIIFLIIISQLQYNL
ncbi:hypothetical protein AZ024_004987, partial [Escherichia coli]